MLQQTESGDLLSEGAWSFDCCCSDELTLNSCSGIAFAAYKKARSLGECKDDKQYTASYQVPIIIR